MGERSYLRSPYRGDAMSLPRLNVHVSDKTSAALRRISEAHQTSMTDTVRRAVAVLDLVEAAWASGGMVQIVSWDGTVSNVHLV